MNESTFWVDVRIHQMAVDLEAVAAGANTNRFLWGIIDGLYILLTFSFVSHIPPLRVIIIPTTSSEARVGG